MSEPIVMRVVRREGSGVADLRQHLEQFNKAASQYKGSNAFLSLQAEEAEKYRLQQAEQLLREAGDLQ